MQRTVISASRRTDIPAFYMPWFMSQIENGFFEVVNPFNRKTTCVPAAVDRVHTLVFWSKNFGPFIEQDYGRRLTEKGYRLFFNFTINSSHRLLEPQVPPLAKRLDQLAQLCRLYGPDRVQWRFDPICYFKDESGFAGTNLDEFTIIARRAADLGLRICITSFVDLYRKVKRRQAAAGLRLYDPPRTRKIGQLAEMAQFLAPMGIQLQLCCEKELLEALPQDLNVHSAACIPNRHLGALHGPDLSLRRDASQRVAEGCGCSVSRDIGSYHLHPCRHNCLFCYANPAADHADAPAAWGTDAPGGSSN